MVAEAQQTPPYIGEGAEAKGKLLKRFTPQEKIRKPGKLTVKLRNLMETVGDRVRDACALPAGGKSTAPIPIPQDFIKRLQDANSDNDLFGVLREILASADDTTDDNASSESQRSQINHVIWEPLCSFGVQTENGIDIICDDAAVNKRWYPSNEFFKRLTWAPTALVAKALRSLIKHERIYRPEQIGGLMESLDMHGHLSRLKETDDGIAVMTWLHDKMSKMNG